MYYCRVCEQTKVDIWGDKQRQGELLLWLYVFVALILIYNTNGVQALVDSPMSFALFELKKAYNVS